jgi:hypothetical protein
MNLQSDVKAVQVFQQALVDLNLTVRLTSPKIRNLEDGGLLIEQPALQVTFTTPVTPEQPEVPTEPVTPEVPEAPVVPVEPTAPEAFPPVEATTETTTPTVEEATATS